VNRSKQVSIVEQPNPSKSTMSSNAEHTSYEADASTATPKYNVTNLLKHIYSLKTVNPAPLAHVQSASSINSSNSSLASEPQLNTAKQFWMRDEQVKECYQCNEKFTTFRRRHVKLLLYELPKKKFLILFFSIVESVGKYFVRNARTMRSRAN
jgi:hypothetical protein